MKRAILLTLTLVALGTTGCHSLQHRGACQQCPSPGHASHGLGSHRLASHAHFGGPHGGAARHGAGGFPAAGPHAAGGYYGARRPGNPDYIPKLPAHYGKHVQQGPPGPAAPSYVYPYYTTRGPRDFLVDNPPTIGR